tara:strand:+ start:401 stop:607 length:207 start_codon:yes stop_codon:yes gene_type:complete
MANFGGRMLEPEMALKAPYFELWMLLELCHVMTFSLIFSIVANYFISSLDSRKVRDYNRAKEKSGEKR